MTSAQRDSRIFLIIAAAILVYQLIIPPVVGLADNGDFAKVIGRFSLHGRVYQVGQYADTVYHFRPENHWVGQYKSIEVILTRAAIVLNSLVSKDGNFDIRCIGAVHAGLFLAAIWLFAPLLSDVRRGWRWLIYGLILFVYCDMMYVNALNSFYMDVPAYLFLLLTAVFFLRVVKWRQKRDAIGLMVCPFLLVSAKTQHVPIAFLIALLFVLSAKSLKPIRARSWYIAAGLLVLAGAYMMRRAQPRDYPIAPLYNVTFEAIVPHSKDQGQTLRELGLDDSYRFCIGMKAYLEGSGLQDPVFFERFKRQYSYAKLAGYYVRRPEVAYRTLRAALGEAGKQHDFGNFDYSTGFRPGSESRAFAWWSDVKRHYFMGRGPVFLFTFLGLSALFCSLLWIHRRSLPREAAAAGGCLLVAALAEMLLATLCDSMDIPRHATLFFVLFDMIALSCAYLAIRPLLKPE